MRTVMLVLVWKELHIEAKKMGEKNLGILSLNPMLTMTLLTAVRSIFVIWL